MKICISGYLGLLVLLLTIQPSYAQQVASRRDTYRIKVVGNTVLDQEIKDLVNAHDTKLTLQEIYDLRDKIGQLYIDAGYLNSGAYVPEQKISKDTVTLKILEGKIGQINVDSGRLNENYVSRKLTNLATPISSQELVDRLHILRLDPLVENISGEISTGIKPGESNLDIAVTPANPFSISTSLNNHKSPAIGSNARQVKLEHLDLLGFGDRIQADYTNTSGSDAFNLGYDIPFSRSGKIISRFGLASNDIVEDAFNALDIENSGNYISLGLNQPLLLKPDQEFTLGFEFTRQHSETSLLGSPFALSRGSDEEGNTDISALRFSQQYLKRNDDAVMALRSQFSLGLGIFGATDNDDGRPDSKFVSWLGQGQWLKNIADDTPVILKSNLQFAGDNLLPLEQLRVGGATTVRGFRRDALLGDNGLISSAEIRLPIWKPASGTTLHLTPFADFGTVWNQGDLFDSEVSTLGSVGMGLNFSASSGLKARLDWGLPVIGTDVEDQPISFSFGYGL